MRTALKLMIIGSVAGLALAGPAFAQSFNPGYGTGNALPYAYAPHDGSRFQAIDSVGGNAYAQAPERGVTVQRATGDAGGYEALLDTH